jgi:hypothetical protein
LKRILGAILHGEQKIIDLNILPARQSFNKTRAAAKLGEKMITLIITVTTISLITLWLMTRGMEENDLGGDLEEPTEGEFGGDWKLTSLSAWMAILSREEPQDIDTDGYADSAPPLEKHPGAASYCPKCKAEFREGFDHCNTCHVELIMYDEKYVR